MPAMRLEHSRQPPAVREVVQRPVTQFLARQDGRHQLLARRMVHALGPLPVFPQTDLQLGLPSPSAADQILRLAGIDNSRAAPADEPAAPQVQHRHPVAAGRAQQPRPGATVAAGRAHDAHLMGAGLAVLAERQLQAIRPAVDGDAGEGRALPPCAASAVAPALQSRRSGAGRTRKKRLAPSGCACGRSARR